VLDLASSGSKSHFASDGSIDYPILRIHWIILYLLFERILFGFFLYLLFLLLIVLCTPLLVLLIYGSIHTAYFLYLTLHFSLDSQKEKDTRRPAIKYPVSHQFLFLFYFLFPFFLTLSLSISDLCTLRAIRLVYLHLAKLHQHHDHSFRLKTAHSIESTQIPHSSTSCLPRVAQRIHLPDSSL
jgi:hypothetical protein